VPLRELKCLLQIIAWFVAESYLVSDFRKRMKVFRWESLFVEMRALFNAGAGKATTTIEHAFSPILGKYLGLVGILDLEHF